MSALVPMPPSVFEAIAERRFQEMLQLSERLGEMKARLHRFKEMAERAKQGSDLERQLAASLLVEAVLRGER